ncbi:hypothetical protein [Streptomyces sp. NPDC093707]|uniref:hypothetical protein n=1 Tax=Streptomyces sp. NPDC093707 TaxID=3154984 RepID=UPI00344D5600
MPVHLRLDGGLHQVPGELNQQATLAHQPKSAGTDLVRGKLRELVQQLWAQPVRDRRLAAQSCFRCHTGTVNVPAQHRN